MNRGHVRSAGVAHLYRRLLRDRGAALAIVALNQALDRSVGSRGPYSPLAGLDGAPIAIECYRTIKRAVVREARLQARRNVLYATRLARANGWGSAGQCPAGHEAKTPAAGARVCRVAAAGSGAGQVARASSRDTSAYVSPQQQAGGGVR